MLINRGNRNRPMRWKRKRDLYNRRESVVKMIFKYQLTTAKAVSDLLKLDLTAKEIREVREIDEALDLVRKRKKIVKNYWNVEKIIEGMELVGEV